MFWCSSENGIIKIDASGMRFSFNDGGVCIFEHNTFRKVDSDVFPEDSEELDDFISSFDLTFRK